MNFKKVMGWMLLIVMLITAYGLFGGAQPAKQSALSDVSKLNVSDQPEISVYGGYTVEEQVSVDIGAIVVMLLLILITSIGSLPKLKIHPEKGSDEELEGDENR